MGFSSLYSIGVIILTSRTGSEVSPPLVSVEFHWFSVRASMQFQLHRDYAFEFLGSQTCHRGSTGST